MLRFLVVGAAALAAAFVALRAFASRSKAKGDGSDKNLPSLGDLGPLGPVGPGPAGDDPDTR